MRLLNTRHFTLCAGLAAGLSLLCNPASASSVELDVGLGTPLMLADQKQTAVVKVSLTGFELQSDADRVPVNIALVIDRSGSMSGEKLQRAKQAVNMAIERLNADDIVSVIAYDHTVRVVVPATKVRNRAQIRRAVDRIGSGGNTALFAGVSKGSHEVRKFLDPNTVNRVILLSDGLANRGPSTPAELGRLGASLAKEGLSVTTIGLGLDYNEDLMTRLASHSDGNHAFAESGTDLAQIFSNEFGDVLSVVAQQVGVRIRCAPGVRPIRVIGRDATIEGQSVYAKLNQLYSTQEKFVLLEVEVPKTQAGTERAIASVDVRYRNMATLDVENLSQSVSAEFTQSSDQVAEETNRDVMTKAVEQIANEYSKEALELRDTGRVDEAQRKLEESAAYVRQNAARFQSSSLRSLGDELDKDAAAVADDREWKRTRKVLKKKQYASEKQQRY